LARSASLLAGHGAQAVVCASAGNLGQALAWSGRGRGLDVTVVASRLAPAAKLDRIRALDARLELADAISCRTGVLRRLGLTLDVSTPTRCPCQPLRLTLGTWAHKEDGRYG
jgi:cysteine synthase